MCKNANREQSIASKRHTNITMDWLLQWIPCCKTNFGKRTFRILKRLLERGILSKSIRLLLFLIQICRQIVASGKQDVQSLIDPTIQTRLFVLFETQKNLLEFPVVIKVWISFRNLLKTCFSDSRCRVISALAVFQGHLGGPDATIRAGKYVALPRYPRIKTERYLIS